MELTQLKFEVYGNEVKKQVLPKKIEKPPVQVEEKKPEPRKDSHPGVKDDKHAQGKPHPANGTQVTPADQPPRAKKQPAAKAGGKDKDKDCRLI